MRKKIELEVRRGNQNSKFEPLLEESVFREFVVNRLQT
jgi:hypothetical protein